ncbi:unnamed protein product [Plasmodium vivax]|uniref:(malaria parasite P. vivax) hypothetical protein n=1 Tax=Plasmodium vivax TaxID=5855 RepID=A0A8S4HQ43_PLAVI|nr:unnamed protein product [Plasmodium vivax]
MTSSAENNKYKFFEDVISLIPYVDNIRSSYSSNKGDDNCNTLFSSEDRSHRDKYITACKKFINIITSICSKRFGARVYIKMFNNDEKQYLNYLLNKELSNNGIDSDSLFNKFLNKFNFENKICPPYDYIKKDLKYIDSINLYNMDILNNLYSMYAKIFDVVNFGFINKDYNCMEDSKNSVEAYKSAIKKCSADNNYLCGALINFRKTYESLSELQDKSGKCNTSELVILPPDVEILRNSSTQLAEEENKKSREFNTEDDESNMFTPVFAPTVGVLGTLIISYKFTPLGSWLRNTVNKKKEIKNTINRETHGLLEGYENNNININSGPYNVRYHS